MARWRRRPTRRRRPPRATSSGQMRALVDGRRRGSPARARRSPTKPNRRFGVRAAAARRRGDGRLRQELSERLPGRGSLAERHAAFRRRHAVPPTRVEAAFTAAVAWCREAARDAAAAAGGRAASRCAPPTSRGGRRSRGRTMPAPPTSGWPGAAAPTPRTCCSWRRTRARPATTRSTCWPPAELVEARGWTERALTPAFGPHRLLAEGAAEAGAELLLPLDVAGTRLRRACCCRRPASRRRCAPLLVRVERLAAALDMEVAHIAADYLDSSLGTEAATTRLRDEALVLDPPGHAGVHREAAVERARLSARDGGWCTQALGPARPRIAGRGSRRSARCSTTMPRLIAVTATNRE